MLDQRLVRMTLQAAVRHAKTHGGSDPRSATIWFVTCVYNDLKKRRWFDHAYTVGRVLTVLKRSETVAGAAAEFGLTPADFRSKQESDIPPPSNTGVTPRSTLVQHTLEEYLNG